MEFEFRSDGKLRYANNSNYKNDVMIRKEGKLCLLTYNTPVHVFNNHGFAVTVNECVLTELKRIIVDSEITK